MTLIRPIAEGDLDALISMAHESGVGFTSLPDNPQLMQKKLARAVASFRGELPPEQCHYMFVMQESSDGPPVGLCGIEARIGQDDVWYNYRLGAVIQASKTLGVYRRTPTLFLSNDLTGATELGSLFLREPARRNRNGSVLSKCRMMFLAAFPNLFSQRVVAEMRGYCDDKGSSPFWDGLGRQFFNIEFSDADFLTGTGDKVFIAELMPKFPIYIPMLPATAQQAIGNVHPRSKPALALLQAEGFHTNGYVDIFDAGPTIECELDRIGGVSRSFTARVCVDAHADQNRFNKNQESPPRWLIGNDRFADFRVISAADIRLQQSQITLSSEQANRVHVVDGDTVRIMSIQPEEARNE